MTADFWRKKKVFVTGHTGFKGSWLSLWLNHWGAELSGYSLSVPTTPSLFQALGLAQTMRSEMGDVRDLKRLETSLLAAQPEIIFHLAAQPLVLKSYQDPVETFATNVMGTVHVLEIARRLPSLRSIIVVTSDKCYENVESAAGKLGYREGDRLGGHDPYSASKACADLVSSAFARSFFAAQGKAVVASARAGNVIGGGDWSADRLLPDIVRSLQRGETATLRHPMATRPWQHVLEPLSGYLSLAEKACFMDGHRYGGAWNFGPSDESFRTVRFVAEEFLKSWGAPQNFSEASGPGAPHEAGVLTLDCAKAYTELGWRPRWNLQKCLAETARWYKIAWENGNTGSTAATDIKMLSLRQLDDYLGSAPL